MNWSSRIARTSLYVAAALGVMLTACSGDKGTEPSPPRTVANVGVLPAERTLVVGDEIALTARPLDEQGEIIDGRTVLWSSSNESVANVTADGRVAALAPGAVTINATVDGKTGSARLLVTLAPVHSVVVSPAGFVLEVGQARMLTVVTKDARGNVLTGRVVTWSADNGNVAVNESGVAMGMRPGYVTITATSEGKSFSVAATVVTAQASAYDLLYERRGDSNMSELFVLPLGTGGAPIRINAGTVSSQPTASPNGMRIAFAVSQLDIPTQEWIDDIFAVDRNGMNVKRLTAANGVDDQPAWSPTAARIAYRHHDDDGRMDVWVMNADGSGQVNLTADLPANGQRSAPAWSPDGARIAFAAREIGYAGTISSIWTMRADGSDKQMITSTLTGFDATPTWSPGGQRIAFIRHYDIDGDITIVRATGGEPTRLAIPGQQFTPAWSPDGELIAYAQYGAAYSNLYTVTPDGSQIRLRTIDAGWRGGSRPAWITRQ
jgi:Tol biopolymer transport system component